VPPIELGSVQLNPICTSDVTDGTFTKFSGYEGVVSMIALPPFSEKGDEPTTLVAEIMA